MKTTKKAKAVAVCLVAVVSGLSIWTVSGAMATGQQGAKLDTDLAVARAATAKYVTDLGLAKQNGYMIITKMIPTMGYHFMNPGVKGFDIKKPPILVYELGFDA